MIENIQNSFEGYIDLFKFYILPINYTTFMDQILIFEPSWIQNTILPFYFTENKKELLISLLDLYSN